MKRTDPALDRSNSTPHPGWLAAPEAALVALQVRVPPGALTWGPVEGKLYLWVRAGHGIDTRVLALRALPAGVSFVSGGVFYPDGAGWRRAAALATSGRSWS